MGSVFSAGSKLGGPSVEVKAQLPSATRSDNPITEIQSRVEGSTIMVSHPPPLEPVTQIRTGGGVISPPSGTPSDEGADMERWHQFRVTGKVP